MMTRYHKEVQSSKTGKIIQKMDEFNDPLLGEQNSVSTGGYQYSFVAISERVVTVVSAYIQLIWQVSSSRKIVPPLEIIKNAQLMFRSDEVKSDTLWKEHCASSLRELADRQFERDCMRFLKCLPKRTDSEEARKIYEEIQLYKNFLNEFAHLRTDSALQLARTVLEKKDLNTIDDQAFDRICTDFINLLYRLFKEYCMRDKS